LEVQEKVTIAAQETQTPWYSKIFPHGRAACHGNSTVGVVHQMTAIDTHRRPSYTASTASY